MLDSLGEEFVTVDPREQGRFIGHTGADIVAIQEGWNERQMQGVFEGANEARAALDPLRVISESWRHCGSCPCRIGYVRS